MLLANRPAWLRMGVFLSAAAGAIGAGLAAARSPAGAAHAAILPILAAYVVLFRPGAIRRIRGYHLLYVLGLAAVVAAYLGLYAHVTPRLRARWTELPLAVYVLLSVHVVVWLIDRTANALLSAVFGVSPRARRPVRLWAPKEALRVICVAAVAGPYLLATFTTHWVKFADATDPWAACGLRYESVRFDATDGAPVAGWFIPAEGTSDAAVVVAGGRDLAKACFLPYARAFHDGGYNVLLLDLRGDGSSGGHARSFGVLEARDVLGAVRYLVGAQPESSRRIFGLGIGQGAAAMVAAAGGEERIEAVVVDSPYAGADASLDAVTAPLPGPVGAYLRSAALLMASAEVGCDLFGAGPDRQVGRISPRPVLIFHGEGDDGTDRRQAEALYAAARAPKLLCQTADFSDTAGLPDPRGNYLAQVLAAFRSVREGRAALQ